jgi:hypothetical protein
LGRCRQRIAAELAHQGRQVSGEIGHPLPGRVAGITGQDGS